MAANRCVGVGKCRQHGHNGGLGDVPLLPGDEGRGALDPGQGPPVVRDAGRPRRLPDQRRLAVRRCSRRARSLPGVQGLQKRLPGQRRHGDLQGRVPLPPLRGPPATPAALRPARLVAGTWPRRFTACGLAGLVNTLCHAPGLPAPGDRDGGLAARDPALRGRDASSSGGARRGGSGDGLARNGAALAGHLHQLLPSARRQGRGRSAGSRRLAGRPPDRVALLWPDLDLDRTARHGQSWSCTHGASAARSMFARAARGRPRAELPASSAPTAGAVSRDLDMERLADQSVTLAELLTEHTPGWVPPRLEGRTGVRPGALSPARRARLGCRRRVAGAAGANPSISTRDVAGWRAISASKPAISRSAKPPPSMSCCRRCASRSRRSRPSRRLQLPDPDPRPRQQWPGSHPPRRAAGRREATCPRNGRKRRRPRGLRPPAGPRPLLSPPGS